MVWADWRYNEELGQWETIVHCKSSEEAKKLTYKVRGRNLRYIVKDNKIIIFKYITAHKLSKILGVGVEY